MRWHGWLGAAVIILAEALLLGGHPVVGRWFTPIVWTGYILVVDARLAHTAGR